ncbi:MAG TPA: hypothetical protein VGK22_06120 [Candidatus Angelobacter sp.]|jgi:hypothetical protein
MYSFLLPPCPKLRFRAASLSVALPLLLLLVAGSVQQACAQEASSQIKTEITRLQQSLKDKPIADPGMPELGSDITASLNSANATLTAGNLYLSLIQLGSATDLLQGARCVIEKGSAVQDSLPAFESEWGKASLQLTALNKTVQTKDWSHATAGIRALAEAAQGRSIPLLEGGRGFATATKPKDGLFYLGQAQGEAEFAVFVSRLSAAHKTTSPLLRSLLPELEALQEKTNAAFQPPRSIDMHPRFIALNSAIKFARELDSSKAYAGALYEYLDALRHYGMLAPAIPDAAKQAALRSSVDDQIKKISASKRDDSIAQIFLERADGWLNKPDGTATAPDEWRSVRVILEEVMPAYYAALKPAAPMQQHAARTATLTLVRWPYT